MKPANSNTEALIGLGPTRIVMRDGRVFEGTPLEIVRDMKFIAFGVDHLDLDGYITWVAANARKFEGVDLATEGSTTEERAQRLVEEMLRTGLVEVEQILYLFCQEVVVGDQSNTEQLDAEADSIITWAAARAGVIVLAPVVGGSFLVANEIYMIARIGRVYGQELTTSAAGGFVAGMAGMVGGQLLAGLVPIPGFSTLVGMGTTFAMGHAAKAWIKDGTPSDVKRYKEVAARARAEADRISDQLKNDPRRNQPLGDESKKF